MPADRIDAIVSLSKRRGFVSPRGRSTAGRVGVGLRPARRGAQGQHQAPVVEVDGAGPRGHRRARLLGHPAPRGLGGLRPRRGVRRPADRVPVLPPAVPGGPSRGGVRGKQAARRPTVSPTSTVPTAATGAFTEPRMFNGLFKTHLGPVEDEPGWPTCGRRPRRASSSTTSTCCSPAGSKPPFGIGQIGKSFRNEITPGNFIFRTREFEQMEMEFFVEPGTDEEWHHYWIAGARGGIWTSASTADNLRLFEHPKEKLSHYSKRTVDIEYRFRFAGSEWGELEGIANRTDFDLTTHSKHSGADLSYFDQETGERCVPYVIEPAAGVGRPLMAFLLDAYTEDEAPNAKGGMEKRTVLRLDRRLAPVKAAVLPLSRNADLSPKARDLAAAAAADLERRLRRRRRDRPPLPPAGRDRHAVLHHRRLRHPHRPGRDGPGPRHDGAGAGGARPGAGPTSRSACPAAERISAGSLAALSTARDTAGGGRGAGAGTVRRPGGRARPAGGRVPGRSRAGPGRVLVLSGPAGVGKTRLAERGAAWLGRPGCGWPGAAAGPAAARPRCGRGRGCWPSWRAGAGAGRRRRRSIRSGSPVSSRPVRRSRRPARTTRRTSCSMTCTRPSPRRCC